MLSCFSRPRDKHDANGGTRRRHRRRINPAAWIDARGASAKAAGAGGDAAAPDSGRDGGATATVRQLAGDASEAQPNAEAAPPPPTPPLTLRRGRLSRAQPAVPQPQPQPQPRQQPQQRQQQQQPQQQPLSVAVARPSWASESSSLDNAAWVAGRRHRCGPSGDGGASEASFTSARSSFSSAVSGPPTEAAVSGFWPPYGHRDPDASSAAPSTRGGSEEGSPRPPRPQVRRVSWYVQRFGAEYGAPDDGTDPYYDAAALNGELDAAAEAAALAAGWRQDGGSHSGGGSGSGSGSSEDGGGQADGRREPRNGEPSQQRVSWPDSELPSLDPQSPEGLSQQGSWQRGRGDDETASTGSADSAALVQDLVSQAEAAHAEGRLLRARELLRQAAARHGCSFGELLADGAAAVFGPAVSCSLDLQQLGRDLDLIRRSLSDAQDTAGYDLSSDGDLRVLYRHTKGSSVHSFRFEAVYDCPVSHMLAITREFDLLATWNRMALDPAILAQPSTFDNVVYTGQWMPFPLSELDLVVRTCWSDLLEEEGGMLITMADHSRHVPGPGLAALPRKAKKRRRIQLLEGSSSFLQPHPCTEDGQQRCRCAVLAHLNPHVPTVPGFVISFVLKVLSPFIYNATKQLLATSFSSSDLELPRRMAAHPELYAKVDERFRSPPHGAEPPPAVGRSLATSFRSL